MPKPYAEGIASLAGMEAFCGGSINNIFVFPAMRRGRGAVFEHLRQIFERLHRYNVKLHPGKCKLAQPWVEYLDHVISVKRIAPNPRKLKAVQEFPVPISVHGVRQFLGMASYNCRFIHGLAKIVTPTQCIDPQ